MIEPSVMFTSRIKPHSGRSEYTNKKLHELLKVIMRNLNKYTADDVYVTPKYSLDANKGAMVITARLYHAKGLYLDHKYKIKIVKIYHETYIEHYKYGRYSSSGYLKIQQERLAKLLIHGILPHENNWCFLSKHEFDFKDVL